MVTAAPIVQKQIDPFQAEAPVDVVGLAESLGLHVWEDDMPEGVSGKLFTDPDHGGPSGYSVVVNAEESIARKRFTIAHEIAHFLLHRDQIDSEIEDDTFYRSRLSNSVELEANRLAADILMPLSLIQKVQRNGTTGLAEVADRLQVSQRALQTRLGIPVVD